ncbi:MAG: HAMP domain-containing protein [Terrimonas sp.]|nr:HAMP domain-containing protein [Terrimonas sp.]
MKTTTDHIFSKWRYLPLVSLLLFIVSYFLSSSISDKSAVAKERKKLENFIGTQQKDFEDFLQDTSFINKLSVNQEQLQDLLVTAGKKYGIYLFREHRYAAPEMAFWNTQQVTPPEDFHALPDGEYFKHLSNGYYVCMKRTLNVGERHILAYSLIPVRYEYFVETDYLPGEFITGKIADARINIVNSPTNYPVHSISGGILFYVDKKTAPAISENAGLVIILRLIAVALLLLFIYLMTERVSAKKGIWWGILLITGSLVLLRLASYYLPFPFSLRQFALFDPATYASNTMMKSLGDFLINSILFWWIAVFTWSKVGERKLELSFLSKGLRQLLAVLSIVVLVFLTFLIANLIRGLVADSQISFNVTDFFSLDENSVIGFVILAAISLGYYYFSKLLFKVINLVFKGQLFIIGLVTSFTGLLYLTLNFGTPLTRFYLMVLLWVLGYSWLLNRSDLLINRFKVSIAGVLFWIFTFSLSNAIIIISENARKEYETRKVLAQRISIQSDPTTERQLSIALTYIDSGFLYQNFHRFFNEYENVYLRDSILKSSGYLNKYDTRLFVFDANGKGLYNEQPESYNTLNTIFTVQAKPTNTPGFYYYETSYDRFTYIIKRTVMDTLNHLIGAMFIVSNPKQYSTDALYPELFRQKNFNDFTNYPTYSYAVYKNRNLVSPFNKYPFATSLTDKDIPKEEYVNRTNGDYDELWYRAGAEKVVVIVKKRDSFIEAITLFSYIFCAFLFMVSLLRLISLVIIAGYKRKNLKSIFQLNIRSQVHSIVILISLISFIVIGFATIRFFINRFERNNSDKLSRTMGIMLREMQKRLADHMTFDDQLSINDSLSNGDIQKLVEEVAEIHNVDVNVYDLRGNLAVSSQPLVYNEGFLSKKMEPVAYYHLNRLKQIPYVQREKMGGLSYSSIYAPVRSEEGRVESYLNIPYFLSQRELNQEISNFLVTIINLNAFIFLIAGAIALVITNRITRSFLLISERMQEINLGKTNEEIDWKRDDEIGGLVKEYNKMVKKLEESAQALAKSEREGAWREMARQVAHEIKNPLTPMKLSIQYLQKSIDNNATNVKELSSSVAKTLVEQIDHLSKIAADFSQFANIGNLNIEYFDLHEVIGSLADLYSTNKDVDIVWKKAEGKMLVKADRTQMNRLFTNLFQNAIEASKMNGVARISIAESMQLGMGTVSITDNGEGIPEEMQSRIFMPNFTTKSSGTGLGLAMCKSIIEQVNGSIWFETAPGKGSTFHVEIPLLY